MKRILLLNLLGMCICSATLFAQPVAIAYWDFEEGSGTSTTDIVGENTGTFMGAADFTADGKYGSGVILDGADSYVDTEVLDPFTDLDEITVMAWFNTADASAIQHILWVG